MEERKEIKQRRNRTNNAQEKQALSREYNRIHREVKRSFRKDRRDWAEELAKEAEQAVEQCDMRKLYNITKTLANKKSFVKKPVKNKENQNVIATEQLKVWEEYFRDLLKQKAPNTTEQEDPEPECQCELKPMHQVKKK